MLFYQKSRRRQTMAKKDSTTINPAEVSIIKAYLEHLVDAAESLRQLAGDNEMLGAVADKVQNAVEQIGYYFDPQFANHREDTDRWIKRLEKAAHENFSRLGIGAAQA
jgi:hypothetical protein